MPQGSKRGSAHLTRTFQRGADFVRLRRRSRVGLPKGRRLTNNPSPAQSLKNLARSIELPLPPMEVLQLELGLSGGRTGHQKIKTMRNNTTKLP